MARRLTPYRRPQIEALEARTGKTLAEIAQGYADCGYSRAMAADELGISRPTFNQAVRTLCPEVTWPNRNASARRKEAYRGPIAEKARQRMRESGRVVLVPLDGQLMPLSTAAKAKSLSPETVARRYRVGDRGNQLWRKPHPTQGKPNVVYQLDLSVGELNYVLDYARQKSVIAAHSKFGVPTGAINAMLNDEWERVA